MTALFLGAIYDLKTGQVPNIINISFIVFGVLTSLIFGWDYLVKIQIPSLCTTLLLTMPGYIKKSFGGADVKILLGLSLLTPLNSMLIILIASFIFFIIYSVIFFRKKEQIPFIPAVYMATCLQIAMNVT